MALFLGNDPAVTQTTTTTITESTTTTISNNTEGTTTSTSTNTTTTTILTTDKAFTFNCENSTESGRLFGLETLTLELGNTENCILKTY